MKTVVTCILLALPCVCFAQFRKPSSVVQSLNYTFKTPDNHPRLGLLAGTNSGNGSTKSILLRKSNPKIDIENGNANQFQSGNTMYNYSGDFAVKSTYEFDNLGNFKSSGIEFGWGNNSRKKKKN